MRLIEYFLCHSALTWKCGIGLSAKTKVAPEERLGEGGGGEDGEEEEELHGWGVERDCGGRWGGGRR